MSGVDRGSRFRFAASTICLSGVIKEGAIGTVAYGGVVYGVYLAVKK